MEMKKTAKLHLYELNGKYGFVDDNNKIVLPCIWKDAYDFTEGLAPVMNDNDRWGYINTEGEVKIECKYLEAQQFKDGWAFVNKDERYQDGTLLEGITTVIDADGSEVGNDLCLTYNQLEIMAKAQIAAKASMYEDAIELILPVAHNCGDDNHPITLLIEYYIALGQYTEAVKWCKTAIKKNEFDEWHVPYYLIKMGEFYRDGLGVKRNLLEAFRLFHKADSRGDDEEAGQLIEDLLNNNPELRDLPEVQNALEPYSDEDF